MSNTYQYQPPNGTEGPVTPINDHTLQVGSGLYFVHANFVQFTATESNEIKFQQKSNFNTVTDPQGGQVDMAGSFNHVDAASGGVVINDTTRGDAFNTLTAGKDVVQITASLQPTDQVFLQDVTQADLSSAFKGATVQPNPTGGSAETLSVPRAGGSDLTVLIPIGSHGTPAASAWQFHGMG